MVINVRLRKHFNNVVRLACQLLAQRMLKRLGVTRKKVGGRVRVRRGNNKFGTVKPLSLEHPDIFWNLLCMSFEDFEELLSMVEPFIFTQDTTMRMAIPSRVKLQITLRFLSSGDSLRSLSSLFRVPHNSISKFLPSVLEAITHTLQPFIQVPQNAEDWTPIQANFNEKWNFPNCCGAVGGKFIEIKRPKKGGFDFEDQDDLTIPMFALVDANYSFLFIDIESYGRASDSGVFLTSALSDCMERKLFHWPNNGVCIGDHSFPLRTTLLKPYSRRELTLEQKIFNYRLTRARGVVDNAFGVLSARFQILQKPIDLKVETVKILVKAACSLHNWLCNKSFHEYIPEGTADFEDVENGITHKGSWRRDVAKELQSVTQKCCGGSNNYAKAAEVVRQDYSRAFTSKWTVPWQLKAIEK